MNLTKIITKRFLFVSNLLFVVWYVVVLLFPFWSHAKIEIQYKRRKEMKRKKKWNKIWWRSRLFILLDSNCENAQYVVYVYNHFERKKERQKENNGRDSSLHFVLSTIRSFTCAQSNSINSNGTRKILLLSMMMKMIWKECYLFSIRFMHRFSSIWLYLIHSFIPPLLLVHFIISSVFFFFSSLPIHVSILFI